MTIPTLTFNPSVTIPIGTAYTILDAGAIVTDGGNALGAIRITLGPGVGSLGVVSGGSLTTTGTIGTINYLYEPDKRLLSLTSSTATGADFTQVLKLVAYSRGTGAIGAIQAVSVSLGIPLYSPDTGHYYEFVNTSLSWDNAKTAASAKSFFGLNGYLATVTSQAESAFLFDRFNQNGWGGGSSFATPPGTIGSNRIWKWETGPESGQTFWNGAAVTGQYTNWPSGKPSNSDQPSSTTNLAPYLYISNYQAFWYDSNDPAHEYFVEYSTATGTGNDRLAGTRSVFTITVQSADAALIAGLVQAATAIEVAIVNGVVMSAVGVPIGMVAIGASNGTHIQVSINLGTTNAGKRRQPQGFRLVGGTERVLISTPTRVGEVYNFVFLKTSVEGSTSVNLVLN